MRHGIAGNKLGRNQTLRKATVRDIAKATLLQQRITTTKAKAKEARKLVDKLITLGKKGTLADKRRAFSILTDHKVVSRLFNRTSPLFKNRNGGYTRIILLNNRKGDNAQLAFLELTEKEEIVVSKPKSSAQEKKASLKSSKKAASAKAPEITEEEAGEKKSETKKAQSPKEAPKVQDTKEAKKKDDKPKNKFSGIRKMFRRKAT